MPMQRFLLVSAAVFAVSVLQAGADSSRALAQAAAVLAGQVSSAEEGAMEGVMVTAKKAGSTIAISVASDAEGKFSFPAAKVEPLLKEANELVAMMAASRISAGKKSAIAIRKSEM